MQAVQADVRDRHTMKELSDGQSTAFTVQAGTLKSVIARPAKPKPKIPYSLALPGW